MTDTKEIDLKPNKWFQPKTLLDKTYEIGILIKGFDGAMELLGGLFLLVVPASAINHLTHSLVDTELNNDPHDFLAVHILHYGTQLAQGHNIFAIIFLLTHGLVKVGLVIALLRQKFWAYPLAIIALGIFLLYQIYLVFTQSTLAMIFLTLLDMLIIWLVWREWKHIGRRTA